GDRVLTYRELAPRLVEHLSNLNFTHVEFLPIMEFPFEGSWGYQTTGYFAPSSRYGTPQDFMFLVDSLHQAGIGVILDWVPSHFPTDDFALQEYDGTHLYEHADDRKGFHPDWKSSIFNYGRHEVRSFLLSSAISWLDRYHVDGLRVDAVASMLYLDYSREDGEWIPNEFGGNENIEAVSFLRQLNTAVFGEFPGAQTFAEESTAWPGVSRPTYLGGLGFGFKWDMGWMHDTLDYFEHDPIHRRFHHDRLTFRAIYAWSENYTLPLSHDEVVHGKGSLLDKMPGDEWQQFANLRCLLAWQFATPGKKLLFQGQEWGQRREWQHDHSLDWHELESPAHQGVLGLTRDAAWAYRDNPAMHIGDVDPSGFQWVDASDSDQSVVSLLRKADGHPPVLIVANFTPVPRSPYRVGVPIAGTWREVLNSDAAEYGGSGMGNHGAVETEAVSTHGHDQSLELTLPPLAVTWFLAPDAG
ncbi:MAG TPA: 1,4-alpha-glucan branching protein GlgB, partial [Nitriliruptoraceae bacterium]|nr:1,4-alpha-glucan branching protein GlgB [Nitriliruptoraceae bacterium]